MSPQIANIRTDQIAAATAVVGYDLLTGQRDARTPYARKLDGLAYVGSANVGDTVVEIFVQGQSVGKYANSSTGVGVDKQKDVMPLNIRVPANALIEAKVTDAASTNAVVLQLEFDTPEYSTGYRKTFRRKSYTGGGTARRSGNGFF